MRKTKLEKQAEHHKNVLAMRAKKKAPAKKAPLEVAPPAVVELPPEP